MQLNLISDFLNINAFLKTSQLIILHSILVTYVILIFCLLRKIPLNLVCTKTYAMFGERLQLGWTGIKVSSVGYGPFNMEITNNKAQAHKQKCTVKLRISKKSLQMQRNKTTVKWILGSSLSFRIVIQGNYVLRFFCGSEAMLHHLA